ncbi:hypothetical protein HDU76_009631 [Blyttiomyces sp. JEL0837]|nr:hypothetical protein HDU76_009631 [Blyttiomyces sp. JEL0837]
MSGSGVISVRVNVHRTTTFDVRVGSDSYTSEPLQSPQQHAPTAFTSLTLTTSTGANKPGDNPTSETFTYRLLTRIRRSASFEELWEVVKANLKSAILLRKSFGHLDKDQYKWLEAVQKIRLPSFRDANDYEVFPLTLSVGEVFNNNDIVNVVAVLTPELSLQQDATSLSASEEKGQPKVEDTAKPSEAKKPGKSKKADASVPTVPAVSAAPEQPPAKAKKFVFVAEVLSRDFAHVNHNKTAATTQKRTHDEVNEQQESTTATAPTTKKAKRRKLVELSEDTDAMSIQTEEVSVPSNQELTVEPPDEVVKKVAKLKKKTVKGKSAEVTDTDAIISTPSAEVISFADIEIVSEVKGSKKGREKDVVKKPAVEVNAEEEIVKQPVKRVKKGVARAETGVGAEETSKELDSNVASKPEKVSKIKKAGAKKASKQAAVPEPVPEPEPEAQLEEGSEDKPEVERVGNENDQWVTVEEVDENTQMDTPTLIVTPAENEKEVKPSVKAKRTNAKVDKSSSKVGDVEKITSNKRSSSPQKSKESINVNTTEVIDVDMDADDVSPQLNGKPKSGNNMLVHDSEEDGGSTSTTSFQISGTSKSRPSMDGAGTASFINSASPSFSPMLSGGHGYKFKNRGQGGRPQQSPMLTSTPKFGSQGKAAKIPDGFQLPESLDPSVHTAMGSFDLGGTARSAPPTALRDHGKSLDGWDIEETGHNDVEMSPAMMGFSQPRAGSASPFSGGGIMSPMLSFGRTLSSSAPLLQPLPPPAAPVSGTFVKPAERQLQRNLIKPLDARPLTGSTGSLREPPKKSVSLSELASSFGFGRSGIGMGMGLSKSAPGKPGDKMLDGKAGLGLNMGAIGAAPAAAGATGGVRSVSGVTNGEGVSSSEEDDSDDSDESDDSSDNGEDKSGKMTFVDKVKFAGEKKKKRLSALAQLAADVAMVKFVSNIPDSDHAPYPVIEAEPHIKHVLRFLRGEDYLLAGAIGAGFPLAHVAWERMSPTIHPKYIPRLMLVQVPFFVTAGMIFATTRSYFRFWGWQENSREVKKWEEEAATRKVTPYKGWQDNDW